MKKISLSILALSLILALGIPVALAQDVVQKTETTTEASKPVNVGNEICPVSGEKINEESKETYEYNGRIYNFCCPMCIDEFKKDPEKYIKKIEEEKQKAEIIEQASPDNEGHSHMQHME